MHSLKGIGASAGIRWGKAHIYSAASIPQSDTSAAEVNVEQELAGLDLAKAASIEEINGIIERTKQTLGQEKAVIFEGQRSMLEDPAFFPEIQRKIRQERKTAALAVQEVSQQFAAVFLGMKQAYMQERAADIQDVGKKLQKHLRADQQESLADISEEVILVADDLSPSETVQLDKRYIHAFVTKAGGSTSHTAILAKSLGIPAVVGMGERISEIAHGDFMIVDGTDGTCLINPDRDTLRKFQDMARQEAERQEQLHRFTEQPAMTADGFHCHMAANIASAAEAERALESGFEGVGLFRTEFIFMDRTRLPEEEEQFQIYKAVVEKMAGKPVIFRTLDIGGDKEVAYLNLPKEQNPFLGYRAIRLCLNQEELFAVQLRALIRASAYGHVKIMFPMISGLEELRKAKAVYDKAIKTCRREGAEFSDSIELGIMVEIPSVAWMAGKFAKEVDFFSIGTNDLVQYCLAVDRMNEKVAHLYDYFHPAVIQAIKAAIDGAHAEGKPAGMCGGMAGDPLAAPLLIGLGLDEWSMDMNAINPVKQAVAKVDSKACAELAQTILTLDTAAEVRSRLEQFMR